MITGGYEIARAGDRPGEFIVRLSNMQIIIIVSTLVADGGLHPADPAHQRWAAPSAPASRT